MVMTEIEMLIYRTKTLSGETSAGSVTVTETETETAVFQNTETETEVGIEKTEKHRKPNKKTENTEKSVFAFCNSVILNFCVVYSSITRLITIYN